MTNEAKQPISPKQCRAARALLGMSQAELAKAADIGLSTLQDFENKVRVPLRQTVKIIQRTLEDAGVEFIPVNGGGRGVRLKVPDADDELPAKPAHS